MDDGTLIDYSPSAAVGTITIGSRMTTSHADQLSKKRLQINTADERSAETKSLNHDPSIEENIN